MTAAGIWWHGAWLRVPLTVSAGGPVRVGGKGRVEVPRLRCTPWNDWESGCRDSEERCYVSASL
jgi:hypothetical protein